MFQNFPTSFLAIDCGNTHCHVGVFRGLRLDFSECLKTRAVSEGTLRALWGRFMECGVDEVGGVIMSSVVPDCSAVISRWWEKRCGVSPLGVGDCLGVCDLGVLPEGAGEDRIANVFGAKKQYAPPFLVVDVGTAVSVDVVEESGKWCGGIILPGRASYLRGLECCALLPAVEDLRDCVFPVIGTTTLEALKSGLRSYPAMIEAAVQQASTVLNTKSTALLIQTGHDEITGLNPHVRDPQWTLKALALMACTFYENENKKQSRGITQ